MTPQERDALRALLRTWDDRAERNLQAIEASRGKTKTLRTTAFQCYAVASMDLTDLVKKFEANPPETPETQTPDNLKTALERLNHLAQRHTDIAETEQTNEEAAINCGIAAGYKAAAYIVQTILAGDPED